MKICLSFGWLENINFSKKIPCQSNLPFVKKSLPLHFVNTKYITIPAASNYARFYGMEVQFYDYYEQKKIM